MAQKQWICSWTILYFPCWQFHAANKCEVFSFVYQVHTFLLQFSNPPNFSVSKLLCRPPRLYNSTFVLYNTSMVEEFLWISFLKCLQLMGSCWLAIFPLDGIKPSNDRGSRIKAPPARTCLDILPSYNTPWPHWGNWVWKNTPVQQQSFKIYLTLSC